MKVYIADAFDASLPKTLSKYGEVTEDKAQLGSADVVLVRSKTKCDKAYIDAAPKLKLIIRGGVGVDTIDVEYAKSKGIKVYNTAEASSIAVAELAFALMIALPNRLVEGHNSMKEGKWLKKELKRTELYGKTLGVIGCGRIGTEIARRGKAFGMKLVGYDPFLTTHEIIELHKELKMMLPLCDYISLNTPLTDGTRGMINRDTLAQMKKGVYLVNTGRGKCVIEADLAEALKSGQVAGYGNDVWYSDPPESTPLLSAPNTILLPHIGASTSENLLRIGVVVDRLIGEYAAGKLK